MTYQTLTFQRKENVAIINMIGRVDDIIKICRLQDELTNLCSEIAWDEEIRVIILAGDKENYFSISPELHKSILETKSDPLAKFWSFLNRLPNSINQLSLRLMETLLDKVWSWY